MNGKKANRKPEKVQGAVKREEVNEDVRTEIMANKMKHKKKRSQRVRPNARTKLPAERR